MKKVLALLLFVCALCTLTACGGKGIKGEWEFESMTMGEETYKVGDETPVGTLTSDSSPAVITALPVPSFSNVNTT